MCEIEIQAQKYGGIPHYHWKTTLAEKNDTYILVIGEKNRQLVHHTKKATFTIHKPSIEFFPLNEWYTASVELVNDNEMKYYCNICMPSVFDGKCIRFTDLDFDVVKHPSEDWKTVDEEEFYENAIIYRYPDEMIQKALDEKDRLWKQIAEGVFPFDGWLEQKVKQYLGGS